MAKKKLGLTSLSLFSSSSNCKKDSSSGGAAEAGLQLYSAPSSSSSSSSCSMPAASSPTSASSWQWPSCKLQPRTLSFRQQQQREMMINQAYKTMNSAYFPDYSSTGGVDDDSGCCFSNSFASLDVDTLIVSSTCPVSDAEAEAVNRAMRSDRLFFEPELSSAAYSSSSSMLVKKKKKAMVIKNKKVEVNSSSIGAAAAFDGATAVSMESTNPYGDFRASMEAMVMSHGGGGAIKDWRWLEEMLGWFLRANGKGNHGLIVGAFVDMLVALTASHSSSTKCYSCSSVSLRGGGNDIVEEITKEEDR